MFAVACGSSSSSSNSQNAPEDATAFDGVTFSFNPTFTFSSFSSTVTYTNTESGSEFPSGNADAGTYTYTQVSTSQGNLDISVGGNTIPLVLTGFQGTSTAISSFTVSSASGNSYTATVSSGNLAPETTSTSTSGSSSTTLPSSLAGQSFDLTYSEIVADSSLGYGDGDVARFVFSSSGTLYFAFPITAFPQVEYGQPTQQGSEYIWTHASNGVSFAVSLNSSGDLNEVNVSVNNSFKGQFTE